MKDPSLNIEIHIYQINQSGTTLISILIQANLF